jgi:predicted ABC-type ATPase
MFAGPNGSGKSTLKHKLAPEMIGVYVNADEIELKLRSTGKIALADYQVTTNEEAVTDYFLHSDILKIQSRAEVVHLDNGYLIVDHLPDQSYFAAAIADFIRTFLLNAGQSFSFETVLSHPSKIEILRHAQLKGYRTYLYYIATEDPAINLARVRVRVAQGGHDVPEDKVRSRYDRSLSLLYDAIRMTNRAYVFDNSQDGQRGDWIAEITNGNDLELKTYSLPSWFKRAVWDKLPSTHL